MKKQNKVRWLFKLSGLVALALLMLNFSSVQPVHAATITVDTTDDELNVDGDCSLREAIEAANTDSVVDACTSGAGADVITFDPSLNGTPITLSIAGASEDLNATGDLDIRDALTISGNGANNTIIDANSIDRVIHIPAATTVQIEDVTITDGDTIGVSGAGILADWGGTTNLSNVIISGNTAVSALGGGVLILGGSTTIIGSTFSGNSAFRGGGLYVAGATLGATVANSTFSGNTATENIGGGGIFVSSTPQFFLTNSTIAGNLGGYGIHNASGSMFLKNTIIDSNIDGTCHNSGYVDNGNNIDAANTCSLSLGFNTDPLLGGLADNGGPTPTMALLPGSPAINAGDNTTCAAMPVNNVDQRGITRPQGTTCDIGAFEYMPQLIVDTTTDVVDANGGNCAGLTAFDLPGPDGLLSLREAICAANTDAGADTITFAPSVDGMPIILTLPGNDNDNSGGDLDILDSVTITGNGSGSTIIDGNNSYAVFHIRAAGLTVVFNDMTIRNGFYWLSGGGIDNEISSDVTINRSVLTGHIGYGVYNSNGGSMTINDSTLHNNGQAGQTAGAMRINGATSTIINRSTFNNNLGNSGVAFDGQGGTMHINNSTFSGNIASLEGGAIYLRSGTLTVRNSSFANNQATTGGAILANNGTVDMQNSILANNSATTAGTDDCDDNSGTGTFAGSNNLINDNGSGACSAISSAAVTNFDTTLQDNGGFSWTHALQSGSNAINAGSASCPDGAGTPLVTDQRGVVRPQDTTCDIGSYEAVVAVVPGVNGGDGPGGVGDITGMSALNLWLNANNIAGMSGASVATWADASGNGIDFSQGTGAAQPTLQTHMNSNGQNVVRFDGTDDILSGGDNLDFQRTDPHSMFLLVRDDSTTGAAYVFTKMNEASPYRGWDAFIRDKTASRMLNIFISTWSSDAVAVEYNGVTFDATNFHIEDFTYDGSSTANGFSLWRDGVPQASNPLVNSLSGDTTNANDVQIGNRFNGVPDTQFDGDLGEIIVYNTVLNGVQRILVENYLQAKYNDSTVDNLTIANDVYDGDTTVNGEFDQNVAGIGQFGGDQHTQAYAAGMIVVDSNFLQDDGDWLLFGHRTPVNDNSTDDLPTTGDWASAPDPQRWLRHYYIDVTDDTTTIDCSVPTTCYVDIIFDYSEGGMDGNPAKMPSGLPSNYRLLRRGGVTGQFSDIATATAIVNDSTNGVYQVHFQGVDVNDLGSNFTLGSLTDADSPTAVTLNSFTTDSQSFSLVAVLVVGLLTLGLGSLWLRRRTER